MASAKFLMEYYPVKLTLPRRNNKVTTHFITPEGITNNLHCTNRIIAKLRSRINNFYELGWSHGISLFTCPNKY
jgi:hypothetical protein